MSISHVMELDKNLKNLMTAKNLKLAHLAKSVGIPKSTIHGWINGARPRDIIELNKVANFFGLNVHELCFGKDIKKTNVKNVKEEEVISRLGEIELVLRRVKE
jgi:transcriptional regulator with XRE-family HTH domain